MIDLYLAFDPNSVIFGKKHADYFFEYSMVQMQHATIWSICGSLQVDSSMMMKIDEVAFRGQHFVLHVRHNLENRSRRSLTRVRNL